MKWSRSLGARSPHVVHQPSASITPPHVHKRSGRRLGLRAGRVRCLRAVACRAPSRRRRRAPRSSPSCVPHDSQNWSASPTGSPHCGQTVSLIEPPGCRSRRQWRAVPVPLRHTSVRGRTAFAASTSWMRSARSGVSAASSRYACSAAARSSASVAATFAIAHRRLVAVLAHLGERGGEDRDERDSGGRAGRSRCSRCSSRPRRGRSRPRPGRGQELGAAPASRDVRAARRRRRDRARRGCRSMSPRFCRVRARPNAAGAT